MRRISLAAIAALIVAALAGCATGTRTAYQNTALAYEDASIAYEAAMPVLQTACYKRVLSAGDCMRIEALERQVAAASTGVHKSLVIWKTTSVQPADLATMLDSLLAAVADIVRLQSGIPPTPHSFLLLRQERYILALARQSIAEVTP